MHLNADIIYDNLCMHVTAQMHGRPKSDLKLRRPVFYRGRDNEFRSDSLYVADAKALPANPVFLDGTVIVCAGSNPPESYIYGGCTCITVSSTSDLIEIFSIIQQTYDRFDAWDERLKEIMKQSADIGQMVDASFPIFENPIQVMDNKFRFLAYSQVIDDHPDLEYLRPNEDGNIIKEHIESVIPDESISPSIRFPITSSSGSGIGWISLNLFDDKDENIGSISVTGALRPVRKSDSAIILHLGKMIGASLSERDQLRDGRTYLLKQTLSDIIRGIPTGAAGADFLTNYNDPNKKYICVYTVLSDATRTSIHSQYLCGLFEKEFSECAAVIHDESIVLCMIHKENLVSDLTRLFEQMGLTGGISLPFSDLFRIRTFYRQACVAFDIGYVRNREKVLHEFSSHLLDYMVLNSVGEFSIKDLEHSGLAEILNNETYTETLRTFLEHNMNISRAAAALYLHKSSMLARINRIRRILKLDLDDADTRLYITLLLKYHVT